MSTKRSSRLALLPFLALLTPFVLAALQEAAPAPWTPAPFHTPRPPAPAVFLRINHVYVLYTHPKGPLWHGQPDPLAPPEAGDLYVPVQNTAHLLGLYYDDDPRYTYPYRNRPVTVVHRGSSITFDVLRNHVEAFDASTDTARQLDVPVRPYYVGDRGDIMVPFHTWVSAFRLYTRFTVYGAPVRGTPRLRFAVRDYTIPGALWRDPFGAPFAFEPDFRDSPDLVPSRFSLREEVVVQRQPARIRSSDRVTVTLESLSGQRVSAERLAVYFVYKRFDESTGFAGTHFLRSPDTPPPPNPCTVRGATVTCTASFSPDPNSTYFGGRVRYVLMRVMTRK